jgi:O-succinylbenzoic acid--CoA ligase
MMSRPTPRRLSVRPGPAGVADVADALRRMIDGDPGPVAIAPGVTGDRPAGHNAALASALREDAPIDHDDAALVVATSGSTGEPQGVLISAPALIAAADRGTSALGGPGLWLVAVPVSGIGGVIAVARSIRSEHEPLAASSVGGARPFTADNFAEDARLALQRAERQGVAAYVSLVPTQLRRLVAAGGSVLDVLAAFGAVLVGGAPLRPEDRAAALAAGVRMLESYGATETCGGVIYNGEPLAGVGLRFLDPVSGAETPAGPGRIVISGPTLALGYRLRPDLTEAAFRPDGFHSPDYGRRVPGRIEVESRLDHIVKVGGVKVSLSAVTNALRAHPRVIDALTVAQRDAEWGMVPMAYVVAETHDVEGAPLQEELLHLVAERLGRASVPRRIEFVDDLPVGHTGKPAPAP